MHREEEGTLLSTENRERLKTIEDMKKEAEKNEVLTAVLKGKHMEQQEQEDDSSQPDYQEMLTGLWAEQNHRIREARRIIEEQERVLKDCHLTRALVSAELQQFVTPRDPDDDPDDALGLN